MATTSKGRLTDCVATKLMSDMEVSMQASENDGTARVVSLLVPLRCSKKVSEKSQ